MQKEESEIRAENKNLANEEVYKKVAQNLAQKGVKCTKLKVDDFGDAALTGETKVSKHIATCSTLKEVRNYLQKENPSNVNINAYSAAPPTSFLGGMMGKITNLFSSDKPTPVASSPMYSSSDSSPMYAAPPTAYHDYASQKAENTCEDVSYDQVHRVMNRKANSSMK